MISRGINVFSDACIAKGTLGSRRESISKYGKHPVLIPRLLFVTPSATTAKPRRRPKLIPHVHPEAQCVSPTSVALETQGPSYLSVLDGERGSPRRGSHNKLQFFPGHYHNLEDIVQADLVFETLPLRFHLPHCGTLKSRKSILNPGSDDWASLPQTSASRHSCISGYCMQEWTCACHSRKDGICGIVFPCNYPRWPQAHESIFHSSFIEKQVSWVRARLWTQPRAIFVELFCNQSCVRKIMK